MQQFVEVLQAHPAYQDCWPASSQSTGPMLAGRMGDSGSALASIPKPKRCCPRPCSHQRRLRLQVPVIPLMAAQLALTPRRPGGQKLATDSLHPIISARPRRTTRLHPGRTPDNQRASCGNGSLWAELVSHFYQYQMANTVNMAVVARANTTHLPSPQRSPWKRLVALRPIPARSPDADPPDLVLQWASMSTHLWASCSPASAISLPTSSIQFGAAFACIFQRTPRSSSQSSGFVILWTEMIGPRGEEHRSRPRTAG
jgi:hypothetical protein